MCAAISRVGELSMSASSPIVHQKHSKTQSNNEVKKSASGSRTRRTFKVIIIGDPNVGKTCLSFRFCNGRFPAKTEATIGVDFRERSIELDDELIKVQLWDTAGQERFRQSMVSHYYRNVHAVVFVYDLTKPATFQNLVKWIEECSRHNVGPIQRTTDTDEIEPSKRQDVPMILVGNKCDMSDEVRVSTNEAQRFADQHDMPLFETSAKMDSEADHVESIFMTLVHKLKESKSMHVQTEEERQHYKLLAEAGADAQGSRSGCFSNC